MHRAYKLACHVHSNWSYDGSWALADLVERFAAKGYRAILMTEHDRGFTPERFLAYREACAVASTPECILVPGIEYSDDTNTIHILTWGGIPFFGEDKPTLAMLQHVKRHGGIAVFAHPSRKKAWLRFQSDWIPYLHGIELWNRKSDGICPSPHARGLATSDLLPFYGLDFHTVKQSFPLAMQLRDGPEPASESELLDALRKGRFIPTALGRPHECIQSGSARILLSSCEALRRSLAKTYRVLNPRRS